MSELTQAAANVRAARKTALEEAVGAEEARLTIARDIRENPYKADFPLLVNNPQLAFLDSAATSQRPACVLDAQRWFQENLNSNPLRGIYRLSMEATEAIDVARQKVADHIGAGAKEQIVFTRNASESLNLLALSYAPCVLQPGDEVCISIMEHHSNLIPWQQACARSGATLVYLNPDEQGHLSTQEIQDKIGPKTKIVSITHVSNVLGVETPIKEIAARAHEMGAVCFVDGAQSVPHLAIDVADLGIDAFAFSGHKAFSPMGIGVLWATAELLDAMPPLLTGGEMIEHVTATSATWAPVPAKFEAGTQDAEGIHALGAALDYMQRIGLDAIKAREDALVSYLMERLEQLGFIQIIGPAAAAEHHGVVAFNVEGIHPHDVASILDSFDVAIRAGHHCAEPLCQYLDVPSCCRASVAFYNDAADIDRLIEALEGVWRLFHGTR